MIRSMKDIAFRFFSKNKLIAATSIIGVMISISLIITMIVFNFNAKESLIKEVETMYGNMDLAVGYNPEQALVIDTPFMNELREHQGIKEASPVYLDHFYVDEVGETYYTVGLENDDLAKSRYKFTEDIQKNEVSLNKGLAELFKVKEGDLLTLEGYPFTVKEIISDFPAAGKVADLLLLHRHQVVEMDKLDKQADFMMLKVNESEDVYELAQSIQALDTELRVDIALEDEFLSSNLDLLFQFMIGLSMLVIIITSLFIISNFELLLYKYKHELSILRSIGASRKQVFNIILLQSIIINLVGGLLAIVFSFLIYRYLQTGMEKVFSITVDTMRFDFVTAGTVTVICMLLIQIFMLIPAYRSSRLLPISIMVENENIHFTHTNLRKKVSLLVGSISVLFMISGVMVSSVRGFILIGSIGFLLSMLFIIPLYLANFMKLILPIFRKYLGNISFVSLKNTIPQVRQNSFVVLIISAMMIIVVFGSSFIQTIQKSGEEWITTQYETEIMISNRLEATSTIDPIQFKQDVEQIESVSSISTQSRQDVGEVIIEDVPTNFDYAYANIDTLKAQGLISETTQNLENEIIVGREFAELHQLQVGDVLDVKMEYSNDAQKYLQQGVFVVGTVVEEFPYPEIIDVLIDWETTVVNPSYVSFDIAFVEASNPALALGDLEMLKSSYPEIQIDSLAQSLAQTKEMGLQRWIIFIVVLVVILLSVMFGVMNTFINNIHAKRKEFAVLRAIHLKPKNIVQFIMTQVTTYIFLGVVIGTMLGMLFTYLILLFDLGGLKFISFNFSIIGIMATLIFMIAYLVLVPFANYLSKLNISEEFMQDH